MPTCVARTLTFLASPKQGFTREVWQNRWIARYPRAGSGTSSNLPSPPSPPSEIATRKSAGHAIGGNYA
jgi:hypothetical protein